MASPGDSTDKITYEKMTNDLSALLDHLQTGPAYILGWSDGAIEALELGMRHPAQVKKIAAMAANLYSTGLHPEALAFIHSMIDSQPPAERDHDGIADEHTIEIFHHIPNRRLCIFPNATHMIPFDDPVLFNTTVDHFFRTPFEKRDRIKDLVKSMEKMKAAANDPHRRRDTIWNRRRPYPVAVRAVKATPSVPS